jgi:hypothetical protein
MQPTNGAKWPEEKDEFGVVVMEEWVLTRICRRLTGRYRIFAIKTCSVF